MRLVSRSSLSILLASVALLACSRDKKTAEGLPPAQDWGAAGGGAGDSPPPSMGNMAPQAGAIGNDPHGGMDIDQGELPPPGTALNADGTDPHAGLPRAQGDSPHGGNPHEGGGVDVSKMGLPAPDPNRAIDPTRFVKGSITVDPKLLAKATDANPVFLSVRRVDATGASTGSPLAVGKLDWDGKGKVMSFELNEQDAMVGGTELTGQVVVTARIDHDSDALSKQPGDITGSAKVTLPADNVKIVLDTVL
ncbi:hypothetical protein BH11MYX2_BH11MYX2_18130 [soil metagenome]